MDLSWKEGYIFSVADSSAFPKAYFHAEGDFRRGAAGSQFSAAYPEIAQGPGRRPVPLPRQHGHAV